MTAPAKDAQAAEWVGALDRLVHRHKLLSLEQAQIAARLISGEDAFQFPPLPPAPPTAPTPGPQTTPEAPPAAGPTDEPSPPGSERL